MWTNVQWLHTTVPLTPIVLMLWDHFSVHVNLDLLAMVDNVKVRAGLGLGVDRPCGQTARQAIQTDKNR